MNRNGNPVRLSASRVPHIRETEPVLVQFKMGSCAEMVKSETLVTRVMLSLPMSIRCLDGMACDCCSMNQVLKMCEMTIFSVAKC